MRWIFSSLSLAALVAAVPATVPAVSLATVPAVSLATEPDASLATRADTKAHVLVGSAIYDQLATYASYPILASNKTCPKPSNNAVMLHYISNAISDTQAVIWKSAISKEIIVSFPGTVGWVDQITDLNALLVPYLSPNVNCPLPCAVHFGFLSAWNSVASEVMTKLNATFREYPDYSVVISGHSLGGALAALAFPSLKNGPYKVKAGYSYGQPRVGNSVFASYLDKISGASDTNPGVFYRVTHAGDPVPKAPPTWFLYQHSRTEYWQSLAGYKNPTTTYQCFGQEPTDCNNVAGETNYVILLVNALKGTFGADHGTYAGMDAHCG